MYNNRWLIWWARFYRGGGLRACIAVVGAVFLGLSGLLLLFLGGPNKTVPLLVAKDSYSSLALPAWQQSRKLGELGNLLPDDFFSTTSPALLTTTDRESGSTLSVTTTIDEDLQSTLLKLLRRYHPQLGAGVLVNLQTGAIEAMAYYRNVDEKGSILPQESVNLCLNASFPAASLFKIVTAYGVLRRKGVTPHTSFPVVGRYHTLYKYQLGLGKSRYRYRPSEISFEKAFARSVNPVFGNLGIDYFPGDKLLEVADSFAFNRSLDFDLKVSSSVVLAPETDYQRAETASGFIKSTTLSPLHAALIAGAPIAPGNLKQPFVIARVMAEDGAELFYHQEQPAGFQLLDEKACAELVAMMQATVKYGTASKSFKYLKRKRSYKKWLLGGKTGTLDMPNCPRRCEWFAGFGRVLKGERKVAIALVLVHGEKRTISSGYIAAEILAQALDGK